MSRQQRALIPFAMILGVHRRMQLVPSARAWLSGNRRDRPGPDQGCAAGHPGSPTAQPSPSPTTPSSAETDGDTLITASYAPLEGAEGAT